MIHHLIYGLMFARTENFQTLLTFYKHLQLFDYGAFIYGS